MRRFLVTLVLVLMAVSPALAGVVSLSWDYTGSGHKGFRLYYGQTSHLDVNAAIGVPPDPAPYDHIVEIPDPDARIYEIALPEGVYYFRMVTVGAVADSPFTVEEPVATIGPNVPEGFKVEWILSTPRSQ